MTALNISGIVLIRLNELRGFIVTEQSSPLALFAPDLVKGQPGRFTFYLDLVSLVFYDRRLNVLKSCKDHLKAFLNLGRLDPRKQNLTKLLLDFKGLFSVTANALTFGQAATRNGARVCPLAFKEAQCMKTCSILTALVFSLERYLITLNSSKPLCKKLHKLKIRYFVCLILVLSFLTSASKLF